MTTQEYLAKRGAIEVLDSAELHLSIEHGGTCSCPACASCDAMLEIAIARIELRLELLSGTRTAQQVGVGR